MAATLRLVRRGKRNKPFFRIVAISKEKDGKGDVLENLGHYDPVPAEPIVRMDEERVRYWLGVGAQPSATVKSLLKRKGLLLSEK